VAMIEAQNVPARCGPIPSSLKPPRQHRHRACLGLRVKGYKCLLFMPGVP